MKTNRKEQEKYQTSDVDINKQILQPARLIVFKVIKNKLDRKSFDDMNVIPTKIHQKYKSLMN